MYYTTCQGISLINHIMYVHVCPYIVTTSTPMTSRVEDESAAHFVAEHREESTSQPRCCQPRRGPKGRIDFTPTVLPDTSQTFSTQQKKSIIYYNYVKILCPKRPKYVKNLYPFSSKHLVTNSQKTVRFHVYLTFDLALDSIGSHKI